MPSPDRDFVRGIVTDLPIPAGYVVTRPAVSVVVSEVIGVVAGHRVARQSRQQAGEGNRLRRNTAGGNDVPGEGRAAGAIGIAGKRIVDGGGGGAKIAGAHGRGGQSQVRVGCVLALPGALIIHEPEELVLAVDDFGDPHRTADREAELVDDVLGLAAGVAEVIVDRLKIVIGIALEQNAVQIVRSRFDGDVDGRAACRTLFGVEGVGADADGLDGFGRRHIGDIDGQPRIRIHGAINARGVGLRGCAVHGDRNGALRIARRGVGFAGAGGGGGARQQQQERLEVLALGAVIGQLGHFLGGDFGMDIGFVRLQDRGIGRDLYGFAGLRNLQADIDAAHLAGVHDDVVCDRGFKGFRSDRDFVRSRSDVSEQVGTALIGGGFPSEAGLHILRGDLSAGYSRAARIGDISG